MFDESEDGAPITEAIKDAGEISVTENAEKLAAEPEQSSEMDDEAVDLEAILLADEAIEPTSKTEQPGEESKESANEQGITARINALKEFAATLDKLPTDADESVKTLMLRKVNKEFINKWLPELENLQIHLPSAHRKKSKKHSN